MNNGALAHDTGRTEAEHFAIAQKGGACALCGRGCGPGSYCCGCGAFVCWKHGEGNANLPGHAGANVRVPHAPEDHRARTNAERH